MTGKTRQEAKAADAKKPVVVLSPKGLMVWVGVLFFSCVWMFTLGVLTGRGTIPVEAGFEKLEKEFFKASEQRIVKVPNQPERGRLPQNQLPKGEASASEGKQPSGRNKDGGSESASKTETFRFYDDLVTKDSPEMAKVKRVVKNKVAVHPPEQKPADIPEKGETVPVAQPQQVNREEKKEPVVVKVPVGKSIKKEVEKKETHKTSGKYSIQVAAFKERKHAEKKMAELKTKGFNAHILAGKSVGGGEWFRVRVGFFEKKSESEGMMKALSRNGYNGFFVSN
jgi:cell division protein FtsN